MYVFMSFSPSYDEKLMEVVAKYVVLYDTRMAVYKDPVMWDNIWKEIGENKLGKQLNTLFVYNYFFIMQSI